MADLLASTTGPQVRVSVEVAPALPAAKADSNQLEMALLNHGVNARDAMPDGGSLRISATRELVSRSREDLKGGDYVRPSVADSGVGMDEATRLRAIEPFFSTKGVGKGTGLGLSMVHGLAAQLGGALAIQSRRGIGTNVELWLPVIVLADAGYGNDTDFRDGITEIGLAYAVGIQSSTSLWPPGVEPLPPKQWSGRSRPTSAIRRDAEHQPISAKQLALNLPQKAWRQVTWREGTNTKLTARFAAVRVRPAHRDYERSKPRPEEWCLIEWPADQPEPTKYFLSTLPANISRRALVNATKLRWRIERDYQDLKQELGLGHYEGRGWRGFHHHATLCIAAYGFLISEKGALPPSGPNDAVLVEEHRLPEDYRPRGSSDQT